MNPRGTPGHVQKTKPWLTPAGCAATGGHRPDHTGACGICGASLASSLQTQTMAQPTQRENTPA